MSGLTKEELDTIIDGRTRDEFVHLDGAAITPEAFKLINKFAYINGQSSSFLTEDIWNARYPAPLVSCGAVAALIGGSKSVYDLAARLPRTYVMNARMDLCWRELTASYPIIGQSYSDIASLLFDLRRQWDEHLGIIRKTVSYTSEPECTCSSWDLARTGHASGCNYMNWKRAQ